MPSSLRYVSEEPDIWCSSSDPGMENMRATSPTLDWRASLSWAFSGSNGESDIFRPLVSQRGRLDGFSSHCWSICFSSTEVMSRSVVPLIDGREPLKQ